MKHIVILLLIFLAAPIFKIRAQKIDFISKEDTVYLTGNDKMVYDLKINCNNCINPEKKKFILSKNYSTYSDSLFNITREGDTLNFAENKEELVVPVIIKYNKAVKNRNISCMLINLSDTADKKKYFNIYVQERKEARMDTTGYRFMIGTNFDFVDGVQVKNLYYHLQVFQPHAVSNKWGFIGGIQQNRLVSQVDTLFPETTAMRDRIFRDSLRLGYLKQVGDSIQIVRLDSVTYRSITSSSVFQIYLEPTLSIFSTKENLPFKTEIHAFIHGDMQFLKTKLEESYTYKIRDTAIVGPSGRTKYSIIPEIPKVSYSNEYRFNYGIGLMAHHKSKYVDLYAKFMGGIMNSNNPATDGKGIYACELNILVPTVNYSIGAEYRGLFKEHKPMYFNVYLSKVFTLDKIIDLIAK